MEQGARSAEAVCRRIAEGDHESAARQFVEEVAFGPGAWENELPAQTRAIFVRTPHLSGRGPSPWVDIDWDALARLDIPIRLTEGSDSPPVFPRVIDRLVALIPRASRERFDGAAHVPHLQTPERYVEVTARALEDSA